MTIRFESSIVKYNKDGERVISSTLEQGEKSVDVSGLYDPSLYRAKVMRVEGMPMFLY